MMIIFELNIDIFYTHEELCVSSKGGEMYVTAHISLGFSLLILLTFHFWKEVERTCSTLCRDQEWFLY